jgi:hypothetical protein
MTALQLASFGSRSARESSKECEPFSRMNQDQPLLDAEPAK